MRMIKAIIVIIGGRRRAGAWRPTVGVDAAQQILTETERVEGGGDIDVGAGLELNLVVGDGALGGSGGSHG